MVTLNFSGSNVPVKRLGIFKSWIEYVLHSEMAMIYKDKESVVLVMYLSVKLTSGQVMVVNLDYQHDDI